MKLELTNTEWLRVHDCDLLEMRVLSNLKSMKLYTTVCVEPGAKDTCGPIIIAEAVKDFKQTLAALRDELNLLEGL